MPGGVGTPFNSSTHGAELCEFEHSMVCRGCSRRSRVHSGYTEKPCNPVSTKRKKEIITGTDAREKTVVYTEGILASQGMFMAF